MFKQADLNEPGKFFYSAIVFTIAVGLTVLLGWAFEIWLLVRPIKDYVSMKPNTALGFVLCGFLLLIFGNDARLEKWKWVSRLIISLLFLISSLTILEYSFQANFGIDQILFGKQSSAENFMFPGRMSPVTALCFFLLSISFFLRLLKINSYFILSQLITLTVSFIALLLFVGYAYDIRSIYRVFPYTEVAIHTVILFFTVSVSLLYIHSESGITAIFFRKSPGGQLIKRLLVGSILLPLFLGFVTLQGTNLGYYGTSFEQMLFAISNIFFFTFLIWQTSFSLDKSDNERRQAEDNARQLASIVEFSNDAIYSLNSNGEIVSWNKGAELVFGYSADEVIGKNITILFPHDSLSFEKEIVARTNKGERLKDYETTRIRKDGSEIYISLTVSPIKNDKGEIIGTSKIARDVTEAKRAKTKISESEENFRALTLATTQAVWEADETGTTTNKNFWWIKTTGQELHGGGNWLEALHPDDREIVAFEWEFAVKNKTLFDIEYRIKNTHNEYQHFRVRGIPVFDGDGKFRQWIGTFSDITERKTSEKIIREANLFNQQIINNVQEGIVVLDREQNYIQWNRFMERITGYSRDDIIGKTPSDIFPELYANGGLEAIELALEGKTAHSMDLEIFSNSTNEYRWISRNHAPNYSSNGEIIGVIITVSDVTERKHYESKINRLNKYLESQVKERTSELRSVNRELEAFSSSVSHDLRAPLRAISGFSLALLEEYAHCLEPAGQDYLLRIRNASSDMGKLIDDLLNLSRITYGEIIKTDVNLSAIAKQVAEKLQTDNPRENVTFEIEENIISSADKRLIKILFENLLGNSYKFTSKKDFAKIVFGQQKTKDQTEYFIKDNGAGFDMLYVEKMFNPFQRLHTSSEFEGTGIGLATVQRIIKKHGGQIRAEGEIGKGTCIYFTL